VAFVAQDGRKATVTPDRGRRSPAVVVAFVAPDGRKATTTCVGASK
jgi:hypothetical protein